MEQWMLILIIAAIAVILYLVLRKNTIQQPPAAVAVPIEPAPGVSVATGQVYSNVPAPPPPNVTARVRSIANPGTVLQNIPVAGRAVSSVANLASNAPMRVAAAVNSSLAHIPVVGSALAAPLNIANKAVSKLNPFNW